MIEILKVLSCSPKETEQIAMRVGGCLRPGDVVAVRGPLGSGKSVIARAIGSALGVSETMSSPSFVIIATYQGRVTVNHIDLYRLSDSSEAVEAGVEEAIYSSSVSLIEWADRIEEILPPERLDVTIEPWKKVDQRLITLVPSGKNLKTRLGQAFEEFVRVKFK